MSDAPSWLTDDATADVAESLARNPHVQNAAKNAAKDPRVQKAAYDAELGMHNHLGREIIMMVEMAVEIIEVLMM